MWKGKPEITVVGGGLAGCEAVWYLASRGFFVHLLEARDHVRTHAPFRGSGLAQLVCSNSLKSDDPLRPSGLLKRELEQLGSLLIPIARRYAVAAGTALAVDREAFSHDVTRILESCPNIHIERQEVQAVPAEPVIVATGPLTLPALEHDLVRAVGHHGLYFYDAIAPVVEADSIDWDFAFFASRWNRDAEKKDITSEEEGDYVNCPMNQAEYDAFVHAIATAEKVPPHAFEELCYFENCSPVELMVERGHDVLRFGPLRPVGLKDPKTGRRPWAVVQLRAENRHRTAFNLVGCQTRMTRPAQERVFRLIPALHRARFLRYGEIHRNTYVDAPRFLESGIFLPNRPLAALSGLLVGVEGYVESMAMGLYAAMKLVARLQEREFVEPPPTCALGALAWYIQHATAPYMPTNVHWGLWPPLENSPRDRARRREMLVARARSDFANWLGAQKKQGDRYV